MEKVGEVTYNPLTRHSRCESMLQVALTSTIIQFTAHRPLRSLWTAVTCGAILFLLAGAHAIFSRQNGGVLRSLMTVSNARDKSTPRVALVVASQLRDNTTWLNDGFPVWQQHIYVTDDPNASLAVPANKGREGMVYLTYIIDNYESLSDITIFSHANRYQWHNDDPLYDGKMLLSRLQLPYVLEQGYVSLRCVWTLGCPIDPTSRRSASASASFGSGLG